MIWPFLAALAFGGIFIALSLLGSDHHADGGPTDVAVDTGLLGVFSLRNLTWASFAFGGIGLLAVLTQRSVVTTWSASLTAGVLTLIVVHLVFRALRRGEGAPMPLDVAAIGLSATLVLPFNEDGVGVIRFLANGQVQELPARRAPAAEAVEASRFADCRIDAIDNGVAIVLPAF